MSVLEIIIFTSLYFVIGGLLVFLTLVVIPVTVKAIRTMWINRDETMEEQYNITFQAIKDQYKTQDDIIETLYANDDK